MSLIVGLCFGWLLACCYALSLLWWFLFDCELNLGWKAFKNFMQLCVIRGLQHCLSLPQSRVNQKSSHVPCDEVTGTQLSAVAHIGTGCKNSLAVCFSAVAHVRVSQTAKFSHQWYVTLVTEMESWTLDGIEWSLSGNHPAEESQVIVMEITKFDATKVQRSLFLPTSTCKWYVQSY